jgi:p-aminobenzoyl-glutamate transporter AbgT
MGNYFTRRAGAGYLLGILIFVVAIGFAVASGGSTSTIIAPVMVVIFVTVGYFVVRRQHS